MERIRIDAAGRKFGRDDAADIEGTDPEVTDMRRMQMHGETVTLIVKARELE